MFEAPTPLLPEILSLHGKWLGTKPDRWTYGDALAAIPKEGKPLGWVLTSMTFTGARLTPPTVRLCHDIIIANTTVNNPGTGYRLYRDGAMTRAEKARLFGRLDPDDGPKHAATRRLKRQRGEEGIKPTRVTKRG